MNIRQELMAARTILETIRAAKCDMPTKISGQEAVFGRMLEAQAPKALKPSLVAVSDVSSDMLYVERLKQILNCPQAASIDSEYRGR